MEDEITIDYQLIISNVWNVMDICSLDNWFDHCLDQCLMLNQEYAASGVKGEINYSPSYVTDNAK